MKPSDRSHAKAPRIHSRVISHGDKFPKTAHLLKGFDSAVDPRCPETVGASGYLFLCPCWIVPVSGMWRLLALCAILAAAGAESVRETAIMKPTGDIFSGSLPDDEDQSIDIGDFGGDEDLDDDDDYDYPSGSGDGDISNEDESSSVVPDFPTDNRIPDGDARKPKQENIDEELVQRNEVSPDRSAPVSGDSSNEIPMAITGHESFFQKTEVIIALIAGGVVGLLFAVFLILLLYFRMKKKDEGTYDLGKKPIYKKAPTNEFYA